MDVRAIIAAEKTDVNIGTWSDKKLRTGDFPLSRKRGRVYPLTLRYRWQLTRFSVGSDHYRLLAAYHVQVPEYSAVLALDGQADSTIIGRWEFHGSHSGWHIHAVCDDAESATPGIVKPAGTLRIPDAECRRSSYLLPDCEMNDQIATAIAFHRYGIPHTPDLLTQGAVPWL